jgi:hypothetical protein
MIGRSMGGSWAGEGGWDSYPIMNEWGETWMIPSQVRVVWTHPQATYMSPKLFLLLACLRIIIIWWGSKEAPKIISLGWTRWFCICNPRYSGGRDQKDHSSSLAREAKRGVYLLFQLHRSWWVAGSWSEDDPETIWKIITAEKAWGVVQMIEYLSSGHDALRQNPVGQKTCSLPKF